MESRAPAGAGGRQPMARRPRAGMLGLLVLATGAVMTSAQTTAADPLRAIAERYVRLVVAVGQHDADYVDAYYGPPEWRKQAEAAKRPIPDIDRDAADLLKALEADAPADGA